MPSTVVACAWSSRLPLDCGSRVRSSDEVQWIVEEVLVIDQPADRPSDHQQRKQTEGWSDAAPDAAIAGQCKCDHAPRGSAEDPSVITGVHRSEHKHRDEKQPPCNHLWFGCMDGGDA